jgi:hypothetical protein
MQARRPVEEDRLPWLEPYRETRKPGKPLPRRGFGKPLAIGAALGVMVAMGAGGSATVCDERVSAGWSLRWPSQ